jgi:hypothetical protein
MSPASAKHRHDAPRNLPAGRTSPAQTEFVAALERLLEPLNDLQEEIFQTRPFWSVRTTLPAENARPRHRSIPRRIFRRARVLSSRLRHSHRSPYRQIRVGLWFSVSVIALIVASLWFTEHMY